MKKIVLVNALANCAGTEMHILHIVNSLKQDFDFNLIVGEKGFLTEKLTEIGIQSHIIPSLNKDEILKKINELKADLIHFHDVNLALALAGDLKNQVPSILTTHLWDIDPAAKSLKTRIKASIQAIQLSQNLSKIICVTEYYQKLASNIPFFDKSKLVTIHNGVPDYEADIPILKKQINSNNTVKILMVARFGKQKNQELLIKSFIKIRDKVVGIKPQLIFVGHGHDEREKKCKELAKKYLPDDEVQFLGKVHPVDPLLREADVFALITNYEAFPISTLEAMRAELPIIASNKCGLPEQIENGVNGFLVENNEQSIGEALLQLINNREMRESMGQKCRDQYKHFFTDQNTAQKVKSIYYDLTE